MRSRTLTHSSGPDALPRGWQKAFNERYKALRNAGRIEEGIEVAAARKAGDSGRRRGKR